MFGLYPTLQPGIIRHSCLVPCAPSKTGLDLPAHLTANTGVSWNVYCANISLRCAYALFPSASFHALWKIPRPGNHSYQITSKLSRFQPPGSGPCRGIPIESNRNSLHNNRLAPIAACLRLKHTSFTLAFFYCSTIRVRNFVHRRRLRRCRRRAGIRGVHAVLLRIRLLMSKNPV